MFIPGLLMLAMAVAMIVGGTTAEVDAERYALVGGGLVLAAPGAFLAYLGMPSRPVRTPPGMSRAQATILDAARAAGEVAGYPMVEVSLEVRPEDGTPFQVKRKFSLGRIGTVEPGRRIDVLYDPLEPQRIELV